MTTPWRMYPALRGEKIQNLYNALGSDFDVGGLEIAVDDAFLVRSLEGF